MTTKCIVYRRSDVVVEIVNPARPRMAELMGEGKTEDQAIAIIQANALDRLQKRGFGPPEDLEILEAASIPQSQPGDREFRNALEKPGMGVPVVNMLKAREIHAERITTAKRLKARDLIEREMMGENVLAEKAALRAIDVQTQIAAAPKPTVLKVVWPVNLSRNIVR